MEARTGRIRLYSKPRLEVLKFKKSSLLEVADVEKDCTYGYGRRSMPGRLQVCKGESRCRRKHLVALRRPILVGSIINVLFVITCGLLGYPGEDSTALCVRWSRL
jgi:hypothetical protein